MLNPQDVWNKGDPVTAAHLNQTVEAVNQIACFLGGEGIDVFRTMGGTTATPRPPAPFGLFPCVLQITTPLTPGGLYGGRIGTFNTGNRPDPDSTSTSATSVTTVGGELICYFLNLPEYGLTTHDLLDVSNEAAPYVLGFNTGVIFLDGNPLFAGIGLPFKTC